MSELEKFVKIVSFIKKAGSEIKDATINKHNQIDAKSAYLTDSIRGLGEIPVEFGTVENFDCADNSLVTLKGAPRKVTRYFDCSNNRLSSLEHGPDIVDGGYDCSYNSIETLEHSPYSVSEFNCSFTPIHDLKFLPVNINHTLVINNCQNLTSLAGAINSKMENLFLMCNENLKSLDGFPFVFNFYCVGNINLRDVSAARNRIKGNIYVCRTFDSEILGGAPCDSRRFDENYRYEYHYSPITKFSDFEKYIERLEKKSSKNS